MGRSRSRSPSPRPRSPRSPRSRSRSAGSGGGSRARRQAPRGGRSRSRSRSPVRRRPDDYRDSSRRGGDYPHRDERDSYRARDRDRSRRDDRDRDRDRDRRDDRDRHEDRDRDHHDDRRPEQLAEQPQLTPEEAAQAAAFAAAAEAAERRAAARAAGETVQQDQSQQRRHPLSLEEMLKVQAEQEAAQTKVKFMTAEERQAAALARMAEKRKQSQEAAEIAQQRRAAFAQGKTLEPVLPPALAARRAAHVSEPGEEEDPTATYERQAEVQAIKTQYLGIKQEKVKVLKPSEKFARNYIADWDEKEDTSADFNPLYSHRMQPAFCFGRGYQAGYDMKEQRKQNNYLEALEQGRQKAVAALSHDEIRRASEALDEARQRQQARHEEMDRAHARHDAVHWSEKKLEDMTERDWRIFREDFDIRLRGGRVPHPIRSWQESGLDPRLLEALHNLHYEYPTPVQRQCIPIGLQSRDLIGIAETGSGKTAAFLLPLLTYVLSKPELRAQCADNGPLAVVLSPTRELATQIDQEAQRLAQSTDIRTLAIVGGENIHEQGFRMRLGCEIVIATPGRLLDCIENHYMVLNQCYYLVLDEADRMIDMGFNDQVEKVLDAMGGGWKSTREEEAFRQEDAANRGGAAVRTTTMFSATMPPEVERLAKKYLRFPAIISIGDQQSSKNKRISQEVIFMSDAQKKPRLFRMLAEIERPVIIFVNAKKGCDVISRDLYQEGYSNVVLHGDKTQEQRQSALDIFKTGKVDILVATDVAGRGLDIPGVMHVINYDMPEDIDRYCHRIGRTGRAGKEGKATSFITEKDDHIFFDLKKYLTDTDQPVPDKLAHHPASAGKLGKGGGQPGRRQTVLLAL